MQKRRINKMHRNAELWLIWGRKHFSVEGHCTQPCLSSDIRTCTQQPRLDGFRVTARTLESM